MPEPDGEHRHLHHEAALIGLGNAIRDLAMLLPTQEQPGPAAAARSGRVIRMVDDALKDIEQQPAHLRG